MKSPVSVALIIMGTVLILAPIGADYLFQRNLVSLLTKEPSTAAAVLPALGIWYRLVCWLTGSLMVLVGTLASVSGTRAHHYEEAGEETDDEDADDQEQGS